LFSSIFNEEKFFLENFEESAGNDQKEFVKMTKGLEKDEDERKDGVVGCCGGHGHSSFELMEFLKIKFMKKRKGKHCVK